MKKCILTFIGIAIILQSCKNHVFYNYYFTDKETHLAKFSEWDKFVGSTINPLRTCYDVTFYDWYVEVQPTQKTISSKMKISFSMMFEKDSIMLDLEKHLYIDEIKSTVPLKNTNRKKDVVFLEFVRKLQKGEKVVVEISYHGSPASIKGESISWGKDKNNKPWISTFTQSYGAHYIMPCKTLIYDEPDSCIIRVGVPKDLVGVANGRLDSITETPSIKIYNWSVKNPINIYNISFNVADYAKLQKDYTDINGVQRKIDIYVPKYNQAIADTFYNQISKEMSVLENLFGVYPWWNDGLKIIESSISDARSMEHQSAISMGKDYFQKAFQFNNYNYILIHELSHEWWGNNITAYDYADLWLHEGFAVYSVILFAEAINDTKYFVKFINHFSKYISNKRPVEKIYNINYNNFISRADNDIYNKGAMFIHTLRMQLNDDKLFFKILKDAQLKFAKSTITSNQFLLFFNEETKRDFTPYFEVYLKQTSPPILEYSIDRSKGDSAVFEYKWANNLPIDFKMKVYLTIGNSSSIIYPSENMQQLKFPIDKTCNVDLIKSGYLLLK